MFQKCDGATAPIASLNGVTWSVRSACTIWVLRVSRKIASEMPMPEPMLRVQRREHFEWRRLLLVGFSRRNNLLRKPFAIQQLGMECYARPKRRREHAARPRPLAQPRPAARAGQLPCHAWAPFQRRYPAHQGRCSARATRMTGYSPHGPLGAGSAPLGNLGTVVPEGAAIACLQAAWDAGIRHYDTAPHYGAGLAEHRLGNALRGQPRDAYTLSTKVGRLLHAAPDTLEISQGFVHALPFRRTFDYTAAGTIRSLEDSHQRMGLSRFDIVYIHDCAEDWHGPAWKDRFTEAMTGAAQVLTALRERGEIRAWGM